MSSRRHLGDPADLRPGMPTDPTDRLAWLLERQTEAMLTLASSVEQLRDEVGTLARSVVSLTALVQDRV